MVAGYIAVDRYDKRLIHFVIGDWSSSLYLSSLFFNPCSQFIAYDLLIIDLLKMIIQRHINHMP